LTTSTIVCAGPHVCKPQGAGRGAPGRSAIADCTSHREDEQDCRQVERAEQRPIEQIASCEVSNKDRHQRREYDAAAIERDNARDSIDEPQHRWPRSYKCVPVSTAYLLSAAYTSLAFVTPSFFISARILSTAGLAASKRALRTSGPSS